MRFLVSSNCSAKIQIDGEKGDKNQLGGLLAGGNPQEA